MHAKTLKIIVLLGCLLPFLSARAGGRSLKERYTLEHPLIFEDAWEKWPYSFVNAEGEPDGFDIELVKRALSRLDVPFHIRLRSQDSIFIDLKNGKADLTFGFMMNHYSQYGQFGNVTITQAQTCLMVPKKDSIDHITIDQLHNMPLIIGKGSKSYYYLSEKNMIDSLVKVEDHIGMAILDMVSRGEGGALWNAVMLRWLIKRYDIKGYALVPTDIPTVEYRFMSNDAELLHAVDSVCLKMNQEGVIDRMKREWIYPESESSYHQWLYVTLALCTVLLLITLLVLWLRHYHMYRTHTRESDIRSQMQLILSSSEGLRAWAYDIAEDTFAWLTMDGKVEREYSEYEFSQFFTADDFMKIHSKITELRHIPGQVCTIDLLDRRVCLEAIPDDYGKAYMICGVEKKVITEGPHDSLNSKHHISRMKILAEEIRNLTYNIRCIVFLMMMLVMGSSTASAYQPLPLGLRYTKEHPLIVVCDWNFAPFSFRNLHGEPDGLLVELIEQLFNQIHVPYKLELAEWHKARQMVNSGEAHLMMDLRTSEDNSSVSYGHDILAEYKVAVARLRSTPPMHSIEMLHSDDTVYVHGGAYTATWLNRYFSGNTPFTIMKMPLYDAITELLAGRIKYYMFSHAALRYEIRRFSLEDVIDIDDIDVAHGGFRFVTTDKQLLKDLNVQFQYLKESGRYQQLVNKWLDDGDNINDISTFDIIAIVGILMLFVGVAIAMAFVMRSGDNSNLKREYKAIANMAVNLTGCNVFAINVKRSWVYNVAGDLLPRKGLSLSDYIALIHPGDSTTEYNIRHRVDEGERQMPMVSFRIRKYNGAPDDWHLVNVNAYIKSTNTNKRPAYVYLVLNEVTSASNGSSHSITTQGPSNMEEISRLTNELIKAIDKL